MAGSGATSATAATPAAGATPATGANSVTSVLVANRGEIARRVIRAAHSLGWQAVAVFAHDDRHAPHVREADLAVPLGSGPLHATYLNVERMVEAAVTAGAGALHPGYGFLSENPRLAEACAAADVVWVGPPPSAMAAMGHKAGAKATVAAAGVPVLPSVVVAPGMDERAVAEAAEGIGYPVLVKASAGGGGRGMRLVEKASGLAASVDAARREAASAFGSDEVFLERYLESPRHVEVQVLADGHGTVVHLFDRECSVQRRHQKVVEEAPAVLVPEAARRGMWQAAVDAARAVGYQSAGTVEFLVDGEQWFFLEMNTRLQVEHGVTELVTGLDLVALQLRIATGEPLPFSQGDLQAAGHAVEVRLCAERPSEGYRPTPGTVLHVAWPAGEGLRVDAGVDRGSVVSAAYDSLVAKLMAVAPDRGVAVSRLVRGLRRLELDGLETNRDLLTAVLESQDFVAGDLTTHFLELHAEVVEARLGAEARRRHAAAAALLLEGARAAGGVVGGVGTSWRNVGPAHHRDVLNDGTAVWEAAVLRRRQAPEGPQAAPTGAVAVAVAMRGSGEGGQGGQGGQGGEGAGDAVLVPVGHVELDPAAAVASGTVVLGEGVQARYRVRWHGTVVAVSGPEGQTTFSMHLEGEHEPAGAVAGECRAPLPGAVIRVLVAEGDAVEEGTALVVMEAMKMEHTLRSGGAGKVSEVRAAAGQQVDLGELLVVVEPAGA